MSEQEEPQKHWPFWNPTKGKNLSLYNDINAQCSESPKLVISLRSTAFHKKSGKKIRKKVEKKVGKKT